MMKQDYKNIVSNFSDEFNSNEDIRSSVIATYALEVLRRGENVYKVLEFVITESVKKEKAQFEVIQQLVAGVPFVAEN